MNVDITIDQAKAFLAVASHGTIQSAATSLNKGHSALLYLIKTLENQIQLQLLDRSGYRNTLTPAGKILLKHCSELVESQRELLRVCEKLQSEWEPSIKLIYDGVIDFQMIGKALFELKKLSAPTDVRVLAAYLHEVESRFVDESADMMVTILPIRQPQFSMVKLSPIKLTLVAHKDHPLSQSRRKKITLKELEQFTLIKIRGVENPLGLSTDTMNFASLFSVNDFYTKKLAILNQLGFGWLPEYLIDKELENGVLNPIRSELSSIHKLQPHLYHRNKQSLGKVSEFLIQQFKSL